MNDVMTNINAELDKALLDFECGELEAESDRFVVDTATKADWAVGKIRQAQQKKEELNQYLKEKIEMLTKFVNSEIEKQDGTIDFMERLLQPYVEAKIVNQKKKSIKLLNGVAGFKSVAAKMEVVDEQKLLEWVKKSMPDKIKVTETVAWGDLKKKIIATSDGYVVTKDGEKVDGVSVVSEAQNVFYVKEGK